MTKEMLEIDATLKGTTPNEKLKEIEDRIWQINMIDVWQPDDYELHKILSQLNMYYKKLEVKDE